MKPGLVTVMIPSYNYADYLTECVQSAAAQDHADVVIVDNGSTDGSPEIGARLADQHDNVRYVRYDTNDGIITSFNRCREQIRGDYTTLLCADDCLTPGSLARSVAFMDAHPRIGLAYGGVEDFGSLADIDLDHLGKPPADPVFHDGVTWIDRMLTTTINPIRTPEAIMRSSVLAVVGDYEPACRYTSDMNLWLRMAAVSDVAYLPGPVQALFRQHSSNEGKAYPHASAAEFDQRWTAVERFLDGLGNDPRRSGWERIARERFAAEARYSASRAFVGPAGPAEADRLNAFAVLLDPDGPGPLARAGWALRRRLGPAASRYYPGFVLTAAAHRATKIRNERTRARTGTA